MRVIAPNRKHSCIAMLVLLIAAQSVVNAQNAEQTATYVVDQTACPCQKYRPCSVIRTYVVCHCAGAGS